MVECKKDLDLLKCFEDKIVPLIKIFLSKKKIFYTLKIYKGSVPLIEPGQNLSD